MTREDLDLLEHEALSYLNRRTSCSGDCRASLVARQTISELINKISIQLFPPTNTEPTD